MIPSYSLIDAVRDIWALWLADTEMRWDVREICAEPWLVKMEGEWLVCSITSHISLVQTESEKREIISTSVILRSGEGRARNSAAKWIIFLLKFFYESRPSNIRLDVWETQLGPALLFSWLGRLWPLQCSRLPDPRGDSASKYLTRNQKIESGGDFTAQIKQSAGNIPSRDAFFSDIFVSGSIKTINCLVTVIITAGEMVARWVADVDNDCGESYDRDDEMRSIKWHESGDHRPTRDTWVMRSRVITEADQWHEMRGVPHLNLHSIGWRRKLDITQPLT